MEKIVYSVSIQNEDKKDNETHIHRHPQALNKNPESFLNCSTLHQIYNKVLERPNSPFLGKRKKLPDGKLEDKYSWYSAKKIFDSAEKFGSGLKHLNLVEPINEWNNMEFQFVGIYSLNTVRMLTADIACGIYDYCIIPLYDTLGEASMELAFDQTSLKTLLVSFKNVKKIIEGRKKGLYKKLENLVVLDSDSVTGDLKNDYKDQGLKFFLFEDVMEAGQELPWAKVTPQSIYAFSYTSGTTGDSKGAMISHQNVCSVACNVKYRAQLSHEDSYLSYLPMPHVLERVVFNALLWHQVKVGVYGGNPTKLLDDLKILKPTVFVSVPRIFNKIYDTMTKKMSEQNSIVKSIVGSAVDSKIQTMKRSNSKTHWLYDSLFFGKAKAQLGGRVKYILTGSAPISEQILDFLKVMFQVPVLEGYGQTEGCAFQFMTSVDDPHAGHVGGPVPQNEYKLVDVPELDYLSTDKDDNGNHRPRGEIWVRGTNIIPGYYKLDEKNLETFTEDGWMKSGDIGQIVYPEGRLQIIDRKKNIFKLSQGEYIAPEKLENAYINTHHEMGDIFVYGDSLKSCLIAIVNFTPQGLQNYAKEKGIQGENLEQNKDLKKALMADIEKIRVQKEFNSLEKIRDLIISTENWEEKDLMTTTLKKKRHDLKKYFEKDIEEIYSKMDQFI